jgi:hypothetical protein
MTNEEKLQTYERAEANCNALVEFMSEKGWSFDEAEQALFVAMSFMLSAYPDQAIERKTTSIARMAKVFRTMAEK